MRFSQRIDQIPPSRTPRRCRLGRRLGRRTCPRIEQLEDRRLLATVEWIGGSGDWNTAANWLDATNLTNHVPLAIDDVVINAGVTVTHSSGDQTVLSIQSDASLAVSGGNLTVNGNLTNAGNIQIQGGTLTLSGTDWSNVETVSINSGTLNLGGSFATAGIGTITRSGGAVNITGTLNNTGTLALDDTTGSWQLAGGTILGGTVSTAGSAKLASILAGNPGTLDGVTLAGTLDLTASSSRARVINDLTLDNGLVNMAQNGYLTFEGTQTLGGTGTVAFTDNNASNALYAGSNSTLTIGPNVTVHGTAGQINNNGPGTTGSGTFINQGTIRADVAGGSILLNGVGWSNSGTIEAINGSTVTLAGTWSNTGTIEETASTLNLGGIFGLNSLLGALLTRSGGAVNITGTLNNTGTLALDDTTGSWQLAGGTILGGTVSTVGSAKLASILAGNPGTLDGVTLAGTLDLTASSSRARVINDLTLDNGLVNMAQNGYLTFEGTQTLGGTGTVAFTDNNASNALYAGSNSTLTIGPNVTVHGTAGQINNNGPGTTGSGTFINQGTIRADVAGGSILLNGVGWSNSGTIEAINGSTVTLAGTWSNTGTIEETASTLNLGGIFGLNSLLGALLTRSGGAVNITGTLNNTGTLALDDTTGSWQLAGGTILGGTVSTVGSAKLASILANNPGTLDGVTLAGTLDLTASSSRARVINDLTLDNGLVNMAQNGYLTFEGTQTLGGTGTVAFTDNNASNALYAGSNSTLTIGPNVTVHGTAGQINNNGPGTTGSGTFINQGTIHADVAGGSILLNGVGWSNSGSIEAINGSTVTLAGTWSNTGTIEETASTLNLGGSFTLGTFTRTGGTVNQTGTLNNTGRNLALDETMGSWTVTGGRITGGTLSTSGLAKFQLNPATLVGVTLAGVAQVQANSFAEDGLTLNGGQLIVDSSRKLTFQANNQDLTGNGTVMFAGTGGAGSRSQSPTHHRRWRNHRSYDRHQQPRRVSGRRLGRDLRHHFHRDRSHRCASWATGPITRESSPPA